jgi:hypothetical protein
MSVVDTFCTCIEALGTARYVHATVVLHKQPIVSTGMQSDERSLGQTAARIPRLPMGRQTRAAMYNNSQNMQAVLANALPMWFK